MCGLMVLPLFLTTSARAGRTQPGMVLTPASINDDACHSGVRRVESSEAKGVPGTGALNPFISLEPQGEQAGTLEPEVGEPEVQVQSSPRVHIDSHRPLNKQLIEAIKQHDYPKTVALLDKGADPNGYYFSSSPLGLAVRQKPTSDAAKIVLALLDKGGYCLTYACQWVKMSKENVLSVLFSRLWDGRDDVRLAALDNLAKQNIDINTISLEGKPFLHHLVSRPDNEHAFSAEAIALLLDRGMDVDVPLSAKCKKTPLLKLLEVVRNIFQRDRAEPVVDTLINHGACIYSESSWYSPVGLLLQGKWDGLWIREHAFDAMRRKGVDIHGICTKEESLLMHAVTDKRVTEDGLSDVVSYCNSVPLTSENPVSPLLKLLETVKTFGQQMKAERVIRKLIKDGACLHYESSWHSPLGLLLWEKWDGSLARKDAIEAIAKEGNINFVSVGKNSLLMHAVKDKEVSVVAFSELISAGLYPFFIRGERPDLEHNSGNTPVKKVICGMYSDPRRGRFLQFLCMREIFQNLNSRDDLSSLEIRKNMRFIILRDF